MFYMIVSSLLFFIQFGTIYHLITIFLMIGCGLFLAHFFMKSLREITRMEAVSKSFILNFYTEILKGLLYVKNCVD